jgi:hypothetical protein
MNTSSRPTEGNTYELAEATVNLAYNDIVISTAESTFSAVSGKKSHHNHLRPTKSSMLRAKSSLGLPTCEGDSSGKSNGISGKVSL